MRSFLQGPVLTALVFLPLVAVPLVAFFGLPQLSPTSATSDQSESTASPPPEVGLGDSTRYTPDDLFAAFETDAASASPAPTAHEESGWVDPFHQTAAAATAPPMDTVQPPSSVPIPPDEALEGWAVSADAPAETPSTAAANTAEPQEPAPMTITDTAPVTPETTQGDAESDGDPWSAAVRRLNELGIKHFRLEPGERAGEYFFSCFYTLPDNPRITHRFESEAPDPLDAVQQALTQIESWQETR